MTTSEPATLHIAHPISDLATWLGAFARFADARQRAGVRAERIRHPAGDDHAIDVELDFDDAEAAERFKHFLETTVWTSREASPALAGKPVARILMQVTAP